MTMHVALIRARFRALKPAMDERVTRLWAGAEAEVIGAGGITVVAEATGMSRTTIRAGRDELRKGVIANEVGRVRRAGAGRPSVEKKTPGVVDALERLVEPVTRGVLTSPLRWTPKSTRRLSAELSERGFPISPQKVGQLLQASGYRLHGAEKSLEGASYADRNKQFELINERIGAFQARGAPVISVDSKKKELVGGEVKESGHQCLQGANPVPAPVREVIDKVPGTVAPGMNDVVRHVGWVNVDVDRGTSALAARSIAEWWECMGRRAYPDAKELLIAADRAGSNKIWARRWKTGLQRFADRTGLAISVSHLPPGTSRWNKIEHRLLCHVFEDWPDRPLVDREIVVQLLGGVRTTTDIIVKTTLDARNYPAEVPDDEQEDLLIALESFRGEWNYTIHPRHERTA